MVAWQAPNWHEVVLLYRACWRLGAIAGPIHHQAGPADVTRMLAVLSPPLFLAPEDIRGPAARLPGLLDTAAPVTAAAARPADLAVALFTSGSTGGPKAALHTQRGLACKARVMAATHQLHPDDAVLMPAPLADVSGLLNAVLLPGAVPMRAHLMARWDPEQALRTIEAAHITFMIGPPTFFVALLGAPDFRAGRVREPPTRVERRRRGHAGLRDRSRRATPRPRQAHLRVDRGANGHDEHRRRPARPGS